MLHAERLLEQRELPAAEQAFTQASIHPTEADRRSGGLWMTHMLRGCFEAAWQQSDAIRARAAHDPNRFWQGESIDGKRVIIRCLHGFGDAVQMLRYLPALQQRCASVTVEVPPRLLDIAPCFRGITNVITWGELAPAQPPEWDVQIEILELPYLFRTTVAGLPIAERYLHLPTQLVEQTARQMGARTRPRIGLVWSTGGWNLSRAIPFPFIQELISDANLEFWNLQGGPAAHDWQSLSPAGHLRDARELGDGILKLAAIVQHMDLVLTPDTLAAHLSGALGKPAWLLLQYAGDWRWMHARQDSPWYPSLRIFRQSTQGDWHGLMHQVKAALQHWKQEQT